MSDLCVVVSVQAHGARRMAVPVLCCSAGLAMAGLTRYMMRVAKALSVADLMLSEHLSMKAGMKAITDW